MQLEAERRADCPGRFGARGYNQDVRIASALLLIACLAGCKSGNQNPDAVRQGVMDYLSQKAAMNVKGMDINMSNLKISGNQADVTVSFGVKGDYVPTASSHRRCFRLRGAGAGQTDLPDYRRAR